MKYWAWWLVKFWKYNYNVYLSLMLQVVEKQRLIEFAESLRAKLNYFDELENVWFEFN